MLIPKIYNFNITVLNLISRIGTIKELDPDEAQWLIEALTEEIDEFKVARENEDIIEQVDALIDLVYFAIGGLVRLGLTQEQTNACFNAVHRTNMMKRQSPNPTRPKLNTDAVLDQKADRTADLNFRLVRILYGKDQAEKLDTD